MINKKDLILSDYGEYFWLKYEELLNEIEGDADPQRIVIFVMQILAPPDGELDSIAQKESFSKGNCTLWNLIKSVVKEIPADIFWKKVYANTHHMFGLEEVGGEVVVDFLNLLSEKVKKRPC